MKFIWAIIRGAFLLVPAVILAAFGLVAVFLWYPASWISSLILKVLPLPALMERITLLSRYISKNPLVLGEREKFAHIQWPQREHPYLYTDVPEDIKRPLWEDGKLVGGVDMTWLADRHMSRKAIQSATKIALAAALMPVLLLLGYFIYTQYDFITASIDSVMSSQRPVLEVWPGQNEVMYSFMGWVWGIITDVFSVFYSLAVNSLVVIIASVFLIVGFYLVVYLMALKKWHSEKAAPYEVPTKDSSVRWPYRAETRELVNNVYKKQIELCNGYLKGSPIFELGEATGTFRCRGDLTAPVSGQTVAVDKDSLFQHMMVFGGTGEGKTTALIKPLVAQVLPDKKYGMYVCDAKGVLWSDLASVIHRADRQDDVIVIGTKEGQCGVDPLASLTPTQVSAALSSVLKQMGGGGSSDSFWADMASNLIRHVLTVGYFYAKTPDGQKSAQNGLNPYSLWWAYQMILSHKDLNKNITSMHEHVKALQKEGLDHDFNSEELLSSVKYLQGTWEEMAQRTKTGIIASVTQLLDGFAGTKELREKFACGTTGRHELITLDQALNGRVVLNALSSVEDGMPARLVNILLKTTLYREARIREAAFKTQEPKKNPQDMPCLVVIDEVQEIATSDPSSGLSDATFWNIARSTGVAGLFATQTMAALTQAIGREAADNFLQQARTKIFFRSEDSATVDYACWCAGQQERNRVFGDDQRESIEQRILLDRWNPFVEVDEDEGIRGGAYFFFSAAWGLIFPGGGGVGQSSTKPVYDVDERFLPSGNMAFMGDQHFTSELSAQQSAVWRAEDLDREYRSNGNEMQAVLSATDMIQMGRWHAYAHVQRAGVTRHDIIRVFHVFD